MEPTAPIVGETEAGRSTKVRRQINKLIQGVNTNTFDLAEMLHEVKAKQYFSEWHFESFSKFAKSLDIKYTKSYYLVRIVENMRGADLSRAQYEPVGLGKLRAISRLKLEGEYNNIPMPLVIRELTLKAKEMSLEEVNFEVDTIMGLTEDESMVWLNVHVKKIARDNVIRPALALAKKHMPESQTTDDEGMKKDPSDGAAIEMIAANFLADPNYAEEDTTPSEKDEVIAEVAAELENE